MYLGVRQPGFLFWVVLIFASLVLGRFVFDGFGGGGSRTFCVRLRGCGEGGGECGCSRLVVRARAGLGRGLMRVQSWLVGACVAAGCCETAGWELPFKFNCWLASGDWAMMQDQPLHRCLYNGPRALGVSLIVSSFAIGESACT
jgi:hypothetical protein